MLPLTVEWVEKAEKDYLSLMRESEPARITITTLHASHAQQCAEKYLKPLRHPNYLR